MGIEREVRTVNGQIMVDEQPQHRISLADPGLSWGPEKAMVHDHQIGLGRNGELDRCQACIHSRSNSGHRSRVLNLQAVDRSIPIVDRFWLQELIAVADEKSQGSLCHAFIEAKQLEDAKGEVMCDQLSGFFSRIFTTPIEFFTNVLIVRSF